MGKIIANIKMPASHFNKDFLECEVAKNLGVKGDDLYNHIKDEYIPNERKGSLLFSSNMMYVCAQVGNDVVLSGTNAVLN